MSQQWKSKVPVSPSTMELPKKMNGEVDWHTLGNILVANTLGEVVCASYVDSKYGNIFEGLSPATKWRYAYEEKDVVVLVKELEDSPMKCFMGRSIIDLPPRVVHDFLRVNENALYWDKYAVESRMVESFREEPDICDGISYMRLEATQCLVKSKRDFLFYVRGQYMPETEKCVISVLSVDYPSFPSVPGVVRGELDLGSGWVLEPYNGDPSRTLVSYLVHADLCGLPPLLVNRAMRRQPLSIHYLRKQLMLQQQQQQQQQLQQQQKPQQQTIDGTPIKLFISRPKTMSNQSNISVPDCSVITPDIPTPDVFCDHTGYTFSAVTLGSNPLYNWTNGSTTTSKDKDTSLEDSRETRGGDSNGQDSLHRLDEGESVLDFRITSMDGGEKRTRPDLLWLPSLRNSDMQPHQCPDKKVGVTDDSPPSSDSDSSNCKSQQGTGLITGE